MDGDDGEGRRTFATAQEMMDFFEAEWAKERRRRPWRHRWDVLKWNSRDAWWWVLYRFHPSHRYHVMRTGLPPGWMDRDVVLVSVIRKIVVDFVEQEKPFDHFDTENSAHAEEWRRLRLLYDALKAMTVEQIMEDKDPDAVNELLIEAIRLRGHYWT